MMPLKRCMPYSDQRGHLHTGAQRNEQPYDNTNKMACAPSEDSDQPGHPHSLIRVFAVRFMGSLGPKLSSGAQWRLWSDRADAQADLSLGWADRPFCWFCHEAAEIGGLPSVFMAELPSLMPEARSRAWVWLGKSQLNRLGYLMIKDNFP